MDDIRKSTKRLPKVTEAVRSRSFIPESRSTKTAFDTILDFPQTTTYDELGNSLTVLHQIDLKYVFSPRSSPQVLRFSSTTFNQNPNSYLVFQYTERQETKRRED